MLSANIDFETRSVCDLTLAGADRYAEDKTTEILCLAWCIDDGPISVWVPGDPDPQPLLDHIRSGGHVAAWNAPFELAIWRYVIPRCCPTWPALAIEQTYCSMARAYAVALPGGLDKCAEAMGAPFEKDKEGYTLMRRMCTPTPKWKKRFKADPATAGAPEWYDGPEQRARLKRYCAMDVEVERGISKKLAPLTQRERQIWLLDQKINQRGVRIDLENVERALNIVNAETAALNAELCTITSGSVAKASAPGQIKKWVNENGANADNLQKHTVASLLQTDLLPDVIRALEIRRDAGRTSVKKLPAMRACASLDGRARGMLGYHVATTGRWAGRRAQPQNLPRPDMDEADILGCIALLDTPRAIDAIRFTYRDPIGAVMSCLRSFLIPDPGNRFICSDFANIEGRTLAWLAGERWKIDAFKAYDGGVGHDLYNVAYARSFGTNVEQVTKPQRQIGKVQELALGYQGGPPAFMSMAANYNADIAAICDATLAAAGERYDEFWMKMAEHPHTRQQFGVLKEKINFDQWVALKFIVTRWRDAHPTIKDFWYDLQRNALSAIEHPREVFSTKSESIRFVYVGQTLFCQLPSRRTLAYQYPKIVWEIDELDDETPPDKKKPKPSIEYWVWDGTHKIWTTARAYGGHLAENATQAVARDILADAMLRLETRGYPIVLHVHDEIVAEVPEEHPGTPELFSEIMCASEPWARGLPVAAKGWQGKRYKKD